MRPLILIALTGATLVFFWTDLWPRGSSPGDPEGTLSADRSTQVIAHKAVFPQIVTDASVSIDAKPHLEATPFSAMISHLQDSLREIQGHSAYTASLLQHVRINGVLREPEEMQMKFRRAPFSVYLFWPRDRQEVLYVDGQNEGRMLVRPTRGLIALRGVWKLRPDSSQAMKSHRYPVTELGIEKLCEQTLQFHQGRNFSQQGLSCRQFVAQAAGRPATGFEVTFDCPADCSSYAKSVLLFDQESKLLVSLENFEWTPGGESGELLERYLYQDVHPAPHLTHHDFDHQNPAYSFR